MSNLIFRADGDAQIGLGHVMRCLALAELVGSAFRFAVVQPAPDVVRLIEGAKGTVVPLTSNDVREFLSVISSNDIAILDGYAFAETDQRAVRERVAKLVFIDDLIMGHQVADVVINHAGGITEAHYDAEPYTTFCLGPHYALLRPEFLRPEGFGTPPTDGPIFVSLGGADPHNTSLMVLEAIRQTDATRSVRVVLGPFYSGRAAIDAFRSQLPNLTILQNLSAAAMAAELQHCSLAITACSTIAYEVCAVNRPLIAIVTADNQDRLAQFLSDEQLALSVNYPKLLSQLTPSIGLDTALRLSIQSAEFSPDAVMDTLANQRRYFDGRSPQRFRALFDVLC